MLQASTSSGTTVSTKKTIIALGQAINTIIYTVPAGRIFTGHIFVAANTSQQFYIDGVLVVNLSGSTNYFNQPIPLVLTAGTVCKSGPGFGGITPPLVGVEEDV